MFRVKWDKLWCLCGASVANQSRFSDDLIHTCTCSWPRCGMAQPTEIRELWWHQLRRWLVAMEIVSNQELLRCKLYRQQGNQELRICSTHVTTKLASWKLSGLCNVFRHLFRVQDGVDISDDNFKIISMSRNIKIEDNFHIILVHSFSYWKSTLAYRVAWRKWYNALLS